MKRFPAAIVAVGLAAFACNRPQPQTREPASAPSRAVDDDAELGRLADERVMSELSVLADAPLAAYVNGVLSAVARQANPTATRWTLRLLDSSHVSVRSGPGGYVYVTRGFLACLGSEAELAAALAHEVAHVSERHWRRQAEYLVKRGVPFRGAHHLVGQVVRAAEARGVPLTALPLPEMQAISPHFGADVLEVFDVAASLASRNVTGGTGPEALQEQLLAAQTAVRDG